MIRKKIERTYGIGKNDPFDIDDNILEALLFVRKYKNNSRSIDKLISRMKELSMSDDISIKPYCIPSKNEMSTYVDDEDRHFDRIV